MLRRFLYFLQGIHSPQFVSQFSCDVPNLWSAAHPILIDALAEKIADMINNGK
jgi:hypothetical protein